MTCLHCKEEMQNAKPGQKFCNSRCRVDHWMAQHPRSEKRIRHRPWSERKKLAALKREREYMRFLAAWLAGRENWRARQ